MYLLQYFHLDKDEPGILLSEQWICLAEDEKEKKIISQPIKFAASKNGYSILIKKN